MRPPLKAPLGDYDVQGADQNVVVQRGGLCVQANFKRIIIMRIQPEIG